MTWKMIIRTFELWRGSLRSGYTFSLFNSLFNQVVECTILYSTKVFRDIISVCPSDKLVNLIVEIQESHMSLDIAS